MENFFNFKATKIIIILILIMNLAIFFDCSQKFDDKLEMKAKSTPSSEMSKMNELGQAPKTKKNLDKSGITTVPLLNFELSKNRLIEYSVKIKMKVGSVKKTRLKLLELAEEFGYAKKWKSVNNKYHNYNNATFMIPAKNLFTVMQKIEYLGRVNEETVNTKDHTSKYFRQNLRSQRMAFRISTRLQNLNKNNKKAGDYLQQQAALENAEEIEDDTKQQKWLLKDKVKWASVSVKIEGPEKEIYKSIEIPDFEQGFYSLIESLLKFIYSLIFIIPFGLLAFALYYGLKKSIRIIKNKLNTVFPKIK